MNITGALGSLICCSHMTDRTWLGLYPVLIGQEVFGPQEVLDYQEVLCRQEASGFHLVVAGRVIV